MCDSGKGETFCERSKKEQSAKKISRYARNDGMVYIALCEIAENRKLSVKGARNDGVQGRFLAVLEMTVGGNGFISRSVQRICLESAIPVSSSRAKSRDLFAGRDNVVCVIAENENASAKGARKSGV